MSIKNAIGSIFSGISRTFAFARVTLANILVILVVVAVIAMFTAGPASVEVSDGTALLLEPAGDIVEQTGTQDPMLLLTGGSLTQTKLGDILAAIDKARTDRRITALVLDASSLGYVAAAHLELIGDALTTFRESGKRLVAKGNYFGRDQYYLASFADTVAMHPMGEVMLNGYGRFRNYYAGLFDKLKVNVHVFRVGTYKSAVEPYTRSDMSEEAKRANQEMVDQMWARFVERVAANRELEATAIVAYADRYDELLRDADGDAGALALEYGLVDQLLGSDEMDDLLVELTSGDEKFTRVAMGDYLDPVVPPLFGKTVAVVPASGTIMMGNQPRGTIGAKTLSGVLRDARDDESVGAVVLRIDSGGGSALASELVRQAVVDVQEHGKPVVASMGGVAASGGYWIAATADEIWAAPTTITGSIGIFGMFPTLEDTLGAVGVARDGVRTGPFVGALDPMSGIGEEMGRALQASIDNGYQRFINLVAEGRDMTPDEVDAIGQGRVWLGLQALDHGLVDSLGELDDAIARAAELAELENYQVKTMEKPLSTQERLLRELLDNVRQETAPSLRSRIAGGILRDAKLLDAFNDPRHIYALCLECPAPL